MQCKPREFTGTVIACKWSPPLLCPPSTPLPGLLPGRGGGQATRGMSEAELTYIKVYLDA